MATFGFTSIGASTASTNAGWTWCQVGAGYLHVAATGDVITSYEIYGSGSASTPVEMVAYDISGGVPQTAVGTPAAIATPGSAAWNPTGTVSHALSNGVTYGVAAGKPGGTNTFLFYFNSIAGVTQRSIDTVSGTPPASWSQDSTSTARISMFANYTPGSGGGTTFPIIGGGSVILKGLCH